MERLITRILRRSLVEQRRGFITSSRQLGTAGKTASLGKQQSNSRLRDGLSLEHFLANSQTKPVARAAKRNRESAQNVPYLSEEDISGNGRKVYFDVYGCQMNVNDTEIAWSILQEKNYHRTTDISETPKETFPDLFNKSKSKPPTIILVFPMFIRKLTLLRQLRFQCLQLYQKFLDGHGL